MQFWNLITPLLKRGQRMILLLVLDNKGSSPGKQGFKMAIVEDGTMIGTIGGGIMEQKLVELARTYFNQTDGFKPFIKHQIHDKDAKKDQSGMICSGEQTVGFYPIALQDLITIKDSEFSEKRTIQFDEKGISRVNDQVTGNHEFHQADEQSWIYKECLDNNEVVHIVGAGHVGLALSRVLYQLGFYVKIYDDRSNLYTLNQNEFVHEKHLIQFDELGEIISSDEHAYVVLVSFGYRTDKIALNQLINHDFKYLGMMGSENKIKQLYSELLKEGISQLLLDKVYAPIGLTRHNKTADEIAVSIAAQIIAVKNG